MIIKVIIKISKGGIQMLKEMTRKQERRFIAAIVLIVLLLFMLERVYNNRDEFQVVAKDESYYGIVEAKLLTKEKMQDFEYLYDVLEENYPFFKVNERLYGIDWLGNKRKYKRLIRNTKSDAEFLVAMERILGDLNDNHVSILDGEDFRRFYKSYYLSLAETGNFRDFFWHDTFSSPYVMYRYQFDGNINDVKLYKEPVLETNVLIEDKLAYMRIKKMASFDTAKEDYKKIKEFLKEIEDYPKLIIDIRGNDGGENDYWIDMVKLLADKPLSVEYYSFFKSGHRYKHDPYRVEGLTTIKQLDEKVLAQFPEEVKRDFNYYKTYSIQIEPADIDHNLDDKIDFRGKIYLLVDRNVYGAAENFAAFAKDTGFATLVGEPTGGGKVFESIPIVFLPNSKFAIRYSRELGLNKDGTINMETKTIPHIQVDATYYEDFNKDKCVQEVIKDGED